MRYVLGMELKEKKEGVREVFFFQAEDGIRDLVRSRGLGDVYKRQSGYCPRLYACVRKKRPVDGCRHETRRMGKDHR